MIRHIVHRLLLIASETLSDGFLRDLRAIVGGAYGGLLLREITSGGPSLDLFLFEVPISALFAISIGVIALKLFRMISNYDQKYQATTSDLDDESSNPEAAKLGNSVRAGESDKEYVELAEK